MTRRLARRSIAVLAAGAFVAGFVSYVVHVSDTSACLGLLGGVTAAVAGAMICAGLDSPEADV